MVTGALTIHSGSTNITYNGSKTEEITIPRNRQTNLTRQAYGSDSSISVKKVYVIIITQVHYGRQVLIYL